MSFIDLLHAFDLKILRSVNVDLAHPWNDFVFKLWSSETPWFLLGAFFFVQSAYRRQWRQFQSLLWLGATIGMSDALAAQVIKPLVGRMRPCKIEEWIRIVEGCAGSLSFPSNHATNGAAFAVFWFLWKGPRIGALGLACAFFVGVSRLYLGMHYPSDVLGGFVIGGIVGAVSYALFKRLMLTKKEALQARTSS